jgi:hypothetical protein
MDKTIRTQLEYWDEVKDPVIDPPEYDKLQREVWDRFEVELVDFLLSLLY